VWSRIEANLLPRRGAKDTAAIELSDVLEALKAHEQAVVLADLALLDVDEVEIWVG
jgi:hypothetical protein